METIKNAKTPPPEIPAGLSTDCLDFIMKCFYRDPSMRPTVKDLLNHPYIR